MFRALLFAAVCALPAFVAAAQGADASALFAQGERAFAAADYREAVRLFTAARDAGAAEPSSSYNLGVSQYRLADYAAAEATFARLAAQFPALRELAEYNRGLALRAAGDVAAASTAFGRARASTDEKIAALANAHLGELDSSPLTPRAQSRLQAYVSGAIGYDDNVLLVDDLLLTAGQSSSSSLAELIGVLSRDFGSTPLRVDATGYWIRYADASEFDQSALRVALVAEGNLGAWTFAAGPTVARSALDGDGFEELIGADLRLRRGFDSGLSFEVRAVYDDVGAGAERFSYLEGSRRQLRIGVQHTGNARVRVGFDLERNERADPGVSASRQRWSVAYQWQLPADWSADTALIHRKSRYSEANVPRDERLVEWSFTANRELSIGWTLNASYRWSDNDSNVDVFSYDGQRVALGLGRSF